MTSVLNLGLGGKCDYRCIFCSRGVDGYFERIKFDYKKEYQEAIKQLFLYSKRRQHYNLSISRDEPANHPFIKNIISFAFKAGFRRICINTSGIGLNDKKFLSGLVAAGLTSVSLPIYGSTSAVHDGIVGLPGAHTILKNVLRRLEILKIKTRLKTVVLRQNLHEIVEIKRQYKCDVMFPYPTDSKLDYKKMCVRLSEIPKSVLRYLELKIPCITGKTTEIKRFGNVTFIHTLNPEQAQQAIKTNFPSFKPGRCRSCKMRAKCEGIFPEYIDIYGDAEFTPK